MLVATPPAGCRLHPLIPPYFFNPLPSHVLFFFVLLFAKGCKQRAKLAVFWRKYLVFLMQGHSSALWKIFDILVYLSYSLHRCTDGCVGVLRCPRLRLNSLVDPPGVDGGTGGSLRLQHTLLLPGARQRGGGGG